MRSSPGDTPVGAGWLVVLGRLDCGLPSDFSWSHLWSHSRRFRAVRSGLPSLGSGATRPNRTGLNHQPQNSKARETRDRSEPHEIAAAECRKLRLRPIERGALRTDACRDRGRKVRQVAKRRARTPTEGVRPLAVSVSVSVVHVRPRSRPCCLPPHTAGQGTANRRGPRFADLESKRQRARSTPTRTGAADARSYTRSNTSGPGSWAAYSTAEGQ
jgi:hypothetical protein